MSSSPKTQSGSGGPLIHLFNGYRHYFRLGGEVAKRPGRDVDLSPPSSAEAKNEWSYTSTLAIRIHGV